MSLQTLKEIKCACGDTFETEIYQSVSVGEDPELKDLILGGEFNMVECPHCHQVIYAENFVLYHDHAQELMAFVYPYAMKENQGPMAEQMKATFSELQSKLGRRETHLWPADAFRHGPALRCAQDRRRLDRRVRCRGICLQVSRDESHQTPQGLCARERHSLYPASWRKRREVTPVHDHGPGKAPQRKRPPLPLPKTPRTNQS